MDDLKKKQAKAPAGRPLPMGGIILIIVGLVFLLRELNVLELNNWWALFMLIPVVSLLNNAWSAFRAHERMTQGSLRSLSWAFLIGLIAAVFLFDLDWDFIWPVMLIGFGLNMVIGQALASNDEG